MSVDNVFYDASKPGTPDRPHPFVYQISIHTQSSETVSIFGRKWIVKDATGGTLVLEGDGVVGQFPKLKPGETFTYNSYHVIKHDSMASGSFFGATDFGTPVAARIPEFEMRAPI